MSLVRAYLHQVGLSADANKNFFFDASAENGSMVLARGTPTQKIKNVMTVDGDNFMNVITPPQFDRSTKIASCEFVQRALGNLSGATVISASTLLQASHAGQILQFFGNTPSAITLPPSASLAAGARIFMWSNATAVFTVYPQGTDTITNGRISPATVAVGTGDSVEFLYRGNGLWLMSGAIQLGNTSVFRYAAGTNSYQVLPSGAILQWGNEVCDARGHVKVTFPIAYTSSTYSYRVVGMHAGTGAAIVTELANMRDLTYATLLITGIDGGVAAGRTATWFSIGW